MNLSIRSPYEMFEKDEVNFVSIKITFDDIPESNHLESFTSNFSGDGGASNTNSFFFYSWPSQISNWELLDINGKIKSNIIEGLDFYVLK